MSCLVIAELATLFPNPQPKNC